MIEIQFPPLADRKGRPAAVAATLLETFLDQIQQKTQRDFPTRPDFTDSTPVAGKCATTGKQASPKPPSVDWPDGAPVKITVLETIPEDPEIILAWNKLVFRMERPEVFFTHQWALAANRAFSDALCPLIFLAYESGQLVGVAAMATNQGSRDTAFFLTASTADYCDIVSEPETRGATLTALLEEMNKMGVRNLILANVPAESQTLRAIKAAAGSHRFHLYQRPAYDCRIISLGDKEQRQSVLKTVTGKARDKRALRKLGQHGPIRVSHLRGEQAEIALRSIFAAQVSRFLATNRLSPLIQKQRRIFLTELGRLLTPAGWLKVSQLEVNGEPIAWNYGFRFFDSWFWYLPTFNIQYEELSPGSCLLQLLTKEACDDSSLKRLDLGLGDEAYKERISNTVSSTRYVQLSRSLSRHMATVGRHWLAASAGRFPAVDKKIRFGRRLVYGLQSRLGKEGLVATTKHALIWVKRSAVSEDEIAFFEAPKMTIAEDDAMALSPLGWENIAVAAMNNANDEQTLGYLMRCARRLRKHRSNGYCLQESERPPSHFLWVDSYDGFHLSEINSTLESSDPNAVMIFDCWTPAAQRGYGNYATAIRLAAADQQKQQRHVWTFSAAKNESSLRGIIKAGFVYRFSMVRNRMLGYTSLSRRSSVLNLSSK
jgi:CelD/BcsL family acetyltransferase involved in cellulose biosynthesis